MKKSNLFAVLLAVTMAVLTACGQATSENNELENGVSAIEGAMSTPKKNKYSYTGYGRFEAGDVS